MKTQFMKPFREQIISIFYIIRHENLWKKMWEFFFIATSESFLIHCVTFFKVNLTLIIYDFQVFLPAWSWQVSGGEFFGCFELLKKPYYAVVSYHENWRSFVLMEERWDGVPLIGKSWSFPTLHIGSFWQNLTPCEFSCHFYAAI